MQNRKYSKALQSWLYVGVFMVLMQVVIGGITRLTDSGLSITEWEVVKGTLPPLNENQWQIAFDKYKAFAKQQYESLHADMTLQEFKVIYFWEYFHRLWARTMGLIFAIPFFFFLYKRAISKALMRRLGVVVALASLAAVFGWIMVASGLNDDQRTWVSAFKLVIHLSIATVLFGYLYYTTLLVSLPEQTEPAANRRLSRAAWSITAVLFLQIVFGGLMAGMRAGLLHPHYPFFIRADGFYAALRATDEFNLQKINDYESSVFVKAWVQVLHRTTAVVLVALIGWLFWRLGKMKISLGLNRARWVLLGLVGVQFLLGVLTLINSIGKIPVVLGVVHQLTALLLFGALLSVNFRLSGNALSASVHKNV